jgi:hypothetical protein
MEVKVSIIKAIFFDRIDHTGKSYAYTLQFGSDPRIRQVPGFPTMGFRRLLAQSQLTNALLRFSSPSLSTNLITQGIRAFPILSDPEPSLQFDSLFGRLLYPLGISFLLPIFSLALVRDKESRVLVMMRMVFN